MKKLLGLLCLFFFLGNSHGFGLPKPVFFTPDIEAHNIMYQYEVPESKICFHKDDIKISILMYHYIRETHWDPAEGNIAKNSLTPQEFETHTLALSNAQKQGKTRLMHMSELKTAYESGCFPHESIIILTADDGRWDNYGMMFPLLQKHKIKMNFGIVTDMISESDTRRDPFMTKSELDILVTSPLVEIQSHTRTHRDLRTLSSQSLYAEICESKYLLESRYGKEISTIIYPVGKYNTAVVDIARGCGYTFGLTTQYGSTSPREISTGPLHIQRIRTYKGFNIQKLIQSL